MRISIQCYAFGLVFQWKRFRRMLLLRIRIHKKFDEFGWRTKNEKNEIIHSKLRTRHNGCKKLFFTMNKWFSNNKKQTNNPEPAISIHTYTKSSTYIDEVRWIECYSVWGRNHEFEKKKNREKRNERSKAIKRAPWGHE